jgi:hypothetical protein
MRTSFLAWLRDRLTPSHDTTSTPLPLALKGGARSRPEAKYAPCRNCGTLVRGAHDCPVLKALGATPVQRVVVPLRGAR